MIEQTKEFESKNFNRMNEIVKENLLETRALNELYRDPFLQIDTIKKMSVDWHKKIKKFEVCLHKLLSIRDHLRLSNFQPNEYYES